MLPNDPIVITAALGFLGTLALATSTIVVASITNRSEKKKTANNTMEAVLRERLLLRDEQLAETVQERDHYKAIAERHERECADG